MCKVRDHCHFTSKYCGAAHSKCNLKYKVPKFIPVAFHNGSNCDNHFIIKQLATEFNGYFSCIGENTGKYISFSITMFKKDDNPKKKANAFSLRFIHTYRFMNRSLSELVDNLSEPGKNIPNDVLKERFYNTYQLYPNSNKKFELLLRKCFYLYEYIDSWKKFNKFVPLDITYYHSELNDADISDNDIAHVKNVCDSFKVKNLGEYHDL